MMLPSEVRTLVLDGKKWLFQKNDGEVMQAAIAVLLTTRFDKLSHYLRTESLGDIQNEEAVE